MGEMHRNKIQIGYSMLQYRHKNCVEHVISQWNNGCHYKIQ